MSVSGICGICESAPAVEQCDRCGTVVCRRHYDPQHGLCTSCESATGVS